MEFLLAQSAEQAAPGLLSVLIWPILPIFLIFYFLFIRPQNKQRKAQIETLANLKKGDAILTRGGIYGKIVGFQGKDENRVIVDLDGHVKITVARAYVAGLAESAPETPEGA